MEKWQQISTKIYKHLRKKNATKKCTTFMWHFLESDLCLTRENFVIERAQTLFFACIKKAKHEEKAFFINFILHHTVHFVVLFCVML